MPALSVIVVSYNSAATLAECIGSVPTDAELILVDQQSLDDGADIAVTVRPDARIIHAGENRGFGAGCNLGAANAKGETLIFLNPDACFIGDAAATLRDAVVGDPGGLVGPLLYEAGIIRPTAKNWSSAWRDAIELTFPKRLISPVLSVDIPTRHPVYSEGGIVPYIQGACMAISRRDFREIGGFDEEYFLYREEESLAYRLARRGVSCSIVPTAAVSHVGKTSTEKVRLFAVRQFYRSRALYYCQRYGFLGAIPRVALLAMCIAMLWLSTLLRVHINYRADKGPDWCRAALTGLTDGLLRRRARPPVTS